MFSGSLRPRCIEALFGAVLLAVYAGTSARATNLPARPAAMPSALLFRISSSLGACLPIAEAMAVVERGVAQEPENPCLLGGQNSRQSRSICREVQAGVDACSDPEAELRSAMFSRGKRGELILQARDEALQILRGENACSAWFRTKDPHAADVFETLTYDIDSKAADYVEETSTPDLRIYSNPYVAAVVQGGGSHQTVKLNAGGAFFRRSAYIRVLPPNGGAERLAGIRYLRVGPFAGNTREAQITTILHEFGHVIDLLPADGGDVDGKSVRNTDMVVQHCRSEISDSARNAAANPQR
jgi:hypothetical protein